MHFGIDFLRTQKMALGTTRCTRRRDPAFTGTLFQCGGGVRFGSLGMHFGGGWS